MEKTFILFIDALPYSKVTLKHMPFLYKKYKKEIGSCKLKPIIGYSDTIRASLFTGTFPDVSDYWMMYKHQKKQYNPLKIVKPFFFLDYLPSVIERGSKYILSNFFLKMMPKNSAYSNIDTRNLPYNSIENFSKTVNGDLFQRNAFSVPSLFDKFYENEIKYTYIESHKENLNRELKKLSKNLDITFLYLDYLDYTSHRYGMDNIYYYSCLKNIDLLCKKYINKAKSIFGSECKIIIFSDHGMTMPQHYININRLYKNPRHGKDYLLFIDSTMIQVWYLNDKYKENIRNKILKLNIGYFLTKQDQKSLRIDFNHNIYGDEIYLINPKYQLFPNYISIMKPKGMHAYHPDYDHQKGVFLSNFHNKKNLEINIPDITRTIYKLMDIKPPKTCEGTSLF